MRVVKDATNRNIVQPWHNSYQRAEQLKSHMKQLETAVRAYNAFYASNLAIDANGIYFGDARYAANMTYTLNGESIIPTIVLKSKHGNVSPYVYLWRFDMFDQIYFKRSSKDFTLTMDDVTNTYTSIDAFLHTVPYGAHWRELEESRFRDMGSDMKGHNLYWESHYPPDPSRWIGRPQWQLDQVEEELRRNPKHRLYCTTCEPCIRRKRIENIVDIISSRDIKHTNYYIRNWCYKCKLPHVYWLNGIYDNGIWRTEHFEEGFSEHFKGQKDTTCEENEVVLLAMEKLVRKCGACKEDVYFIRRNNGSEEYGYHPRQGIEDQGIGYRTSLLDEHRRWHDGETKDKRYTDKEIADFFPFAKIKHAPLYKTREDWFAELRQFHLSNINGTNILDYL
jgi:hypothetical protein